jgi:hypothetical protein
LDCCNIHTRKKERKKERKKRKKERNSTFLTYDNSEPKIEGNLLIERPYGDHVAPHYWRPRRAKMGPYIRRLYINLANQTVENIAK